jgi:hypothetical protein
VKAKVIHLDKPHQGEIAYIVRGFVEFEVMSYHSDGVGVSGGCHQWVVGITENYEKASDKIREITEWMDLYLDRHLTDFTEDNVSWYSPTGLYCPDDHKMTNFATDSDSTYSFKRPWYAIEESRFLE